MPDTASSLFDTAELWRIEPEAALDALLGSGRFADTSRAPAVVAGESGPRPLSRSSAQVYRAMFGRYLRHLAAARPAAHSLFDADTADVESFVTMDLADASRETLWRYLRLLERIHEHLVRRGWRAGNPVAQWVVARTVDGQVRALMDSRRASADPVVDATTVARLQAWITAQGIAALGAGDWKRARDLTLAALSLGTGLRYAEVAKLRRRQVTPQAGGAERATTHGAQFELDLPGWASAATVRPHRVFAGGPCAELLAAWVADRWNGAAGLGSIPGDLLFPATASGRPVSATVVYRKLGALAAEAVAAGVLDDGTRWVLEAGAQGLRRAYVIAELAQGRDKELLTERLGHWQPRSVERYGPAARKVEGATKPRRPPRRGA
jgi:integrase